MTQRTVSISIDELRVGVTSSHPLKDDNGLLLLGANTRITQQLITGLRERGIGAIHVDSRDIAALCGIAKKKQLGAKREKQCSSASAEWVKSKSVKEMLIDRYVEELSEERSEQLKGAMGMAKERFGELKSKILKEKIRSVGPLNEISNCYARLMVDDHDQTVGTIGDSTKIADAGERAVQMSVLGMAVAIELGHDGPETLEVGMAGLLHDVGLYAMDPKFQEPIELLDESEQWEYRKHPLVSVLCVADVMDLPHSVQLAMQQVHEQFDGSGYPRGVRGRRIHPYARILNVVDTYLQLTSSVPHRRAIVPHDALGFMLHQASRGIFDPRVIHAFLNTQTLFPLGSMVELDSGELARVIRRPRFGFAEPILLGSDGDRIELEESESQIVRPVSDPVIDQVRLPTEMMKASDWHPASNVLVV